MTYIKTTNKTRRAERQKEEKRLLDLGFGSVITKSERNLKRDATKTKGLKFSRCKTLEMIPRGPNQDGVIIIRGNTLKNTSKRKNRDSRIHVFSASHPAVVNRVPAALVSVMLA